jgi:intracellular sulfur oxidation DsrE/DsrF family protein
MFRRVTITAALGLATGAAAITLGAGPAAAASTFGAQWNMNEPSGTTMLDSSGNGNNGTTSNVTRTSAGYVFNGTTSKVVVPNSPTLNPGTSEFSYSVTVQTSRVPPSGTDYDLIRKGISSTSGGEYKLEIVYSSTGGRAFCLVKDNLKVSATVKGTTNVTDGKVHTLTCKKTSTGVTLQVDTLAPRTQVVSSGLGAISNTSPLTISAKTPTVTGVGGDFYSGTMRSARLSLG